MPWRVAPAKALRHARSLPCALDIKIGIRNNLPVINDFDHGYRMLGRRWYYPLVALACLAAAPNSQGGVAPHQREVLLRLQVPNQTSEELPMARPGRGKSNALITPTVNTPDWTALSTAAAVSQAKNAADQTEIMRNQEWISGLTLLAAIVAAAFAGRAVYWTSKASAHAESSAKASNEQVSVSQEALRPHIIVDAITASLGGTGMIRVTFSNQGNSTARLVKADVLFRVYAIYENEQSLSKSYEEKSMYVPPVPTSGTVEQEFGFNFAEDAELLSRIIVAAIPCRLFHLLIDITVAYVWPFGTGKGHFVTSVMGWERTLEPSGGFMRGTSENIREIEY